MRSNDVNCNIDYLDYYEISKNFVNFDHNNLIHIIIDFPLLVFTFQFLFYSTLYNSQLLNIINFSMKDRSLLNFSLHSYWILDFVREFFLLVNLYSLISIHSHLNQKSTFIRFFENLLVD